MITYLLYIICLGFIQRYLFLDIVAHGLAFMVMPGWSLGA